MRENTSSAAILCSVISAMSARMVASSLPTSARKSRSTWMICSSISATLFLFSAVDAISWPVRNSYVYGDHGCVTLVGVEDLIVVAMEDAILVASKEEAESIRQVVDRLKNDGHYQAMQHARGYRPWGWHQGLNHGDRYQVKCIMVKSKAKLSLQSHHHRSEHWVVVTGTVEVTRGAIG